MQGCKLLGFPANESHAQLILGRRDTVQVLVSVHFANCLNMLNRDAYS